jgi:hypothetical protein
MTHKIVTRFEMSLPTGRGDQWVRSWGLVRKRDDTGRLCGRYGGGGNAASFIGALLSKHSVRCSNMKVNRRKYRAEEKTCQYNSLDGNQRRR